MNNIEINIRYAGADVAINIFPEESCNGNIYPIEANGKYMFTLLEDEDGAWSIMKEADATVPFVDEDLYAAILKKLHYELKYAA